MENEIGCYILQLKSHTKEVDGTIHVTVKLVGKGGPPHSMCQQPTTPAVLDG